MSWVFYAPTVPTGGPHIPETVLEAGSGLFSGMKNPSAPGKITGTEGFVEPPVGFEPTTPALQERCSGQLS